MKKFLVLTLIVLAIVLSLSSCVDDEEPPIHVHTEEIIPAVESTCTETGLSEGKKCSDCGEILIAQEVIPLKEHTESDWIIDLEPTTEVEGSKHTECTVCGITLKTEAIEKILVASEGLEFALNEDGQSYSVIGIGTCTDKNIVIPSTYNGLPVTSIDAHAFYYCESLTSINIPDSVTSIGDYAFEYCQSLSSITIPNSVTSIGNYAFYVCLSLTSINIPDSVTSIGNYAFSNCGSLTSIEVDENNAEYKSIEGNLYNKDGTVLIQYATGKQDISFEIPDSVTSIGYIAFCGCDSLTSVTIPDSVTSIGDDAFWGCISLTSINIPDSVTSIGHYAFYGCNALASITIPYSVNSIGERAFKYCGKLTIYCEAESQPKAWSTDWNPSDRPVVWGYKGE